MHPWAMLSMLSGWDPRIHPTESMGGTPHIHPTESMGGTPHIHPTESMDGTPSTHPTEPTDSSGQPDIQLARSGIHGQRGAV